MAIYSFEGKRPSIAASAYVSPSAEVIGQVTIGARCYIGHGAIIRGDYGSIEIGDETAIEEGAIIHARPEDWTRIEARVTVGHGAMIHNATIRQGAVIGMRAVISDFSEVGAGAIVGEMALVKNSQRIPAGKVAVGLPAKVVCDVDQRHRPMTHWAKELYAALADRYNAGGMVELLARDPGAAALPAGDPGAAALPAGDPDAAALPAGDPGAAALPAGDPGAAALPARDPDAAALPELIPIGTIHTPFAQRAGMPIQGGLARDVEGEIQLLPAYEQGLADLEGFSHVFLLYAFHQSEGFSLTVTPFLDTQPRGLFSTRAPRRPNPIGLTVVRLLGVEGTTLRFAGADMLDGTPLLDIKPYVSRFDHGEDTRVGWLEHRLERIDGGGPRSDDRFTRAEGPEGGEEGDETA